MKRTRLFQCVEAGILCLLTFSLIRTCLASNVLWGFKNEDLAVQLSVTPSEIYPGENLTVICQVNATSNIRNLYLTINLLAPDHSGLWKETESLLFDLEMQDLQTYTGNTTIETPQDLTPGALYSQIYLDYKVFHSPSYEGKTQDASLILASLKNRDYELLQQEFQSLTQNYTELNSTFQDLQRKYSSQSGDTGSARNLSYGLMATTGICALTAGALAVKRKKNPPAP